MTAFVLRMPAGIPGNLTRNEHAHVQAALLDTTNYPTEFGVPVVIDASTQALRKVLAGDTAEVINAFYVRPYPLQGNGTDGLGTSTPPTSGIGNRMRRGYMMVKLNAGTAAQDGLVYVRTANASAGKPIGGIEAAQEWGSASAAKSGGNTGNGTLVLDATTPVLANARAGVYTVRNIEVVTNGGKFEVRDPLGRVLGIAIIPAGAGGSITFSNQVKFALTDAGTDFALGDGFDITVTANTLALPASTTFTGPADSAGNVEIAHNI